MRSVLRALVWRGEGSAIIAPPLFRNFKINTENIGSFKLGIEKFIYFFFFEDDDDNSTVFNQSFCTPVIEDKRQHVKNTFL